MANIQTRTTADNRVMYTARIRIKGFPQQTATFSRLTDAKQWAQKTEATRSPCHGPQLFLHQQPALHEQAKPNRRCWKRRNSGSE